MVTATVSTHTVPLNTGASIPLVALGTWQANDEDTYNAVLTAIKAGYRHIDTAHVYKNEAAVGRAVRDCGVPRGELFVTTKLWCTNHRIAGEALKGSIERLGLEYVDLYLMHWPVPMLKDPADPDTFFVMKPDGSVNNDPDWDFIKTWELLQELPATGLTKAVGVSNFSITNLTKLLEAPTTKVVPAANQVELHPLLPQTRLVEFCQSKGIVVEAYSPLGSSGSPLLKNESLLKIAGELGIPPATLAISWAVWRKTVVLPKSVSASRIESNIKVVELTDAQGEAITAIGAERPVRHVAADRDWGVPVFNDEDDLSMKRK
ncbi:unnamed protein product [Kuraishia capsulata CBS 1993]|uniref:2-dehydropantolactone reductase n=1 Tax=Kuraishia capsulata CBS 1993 TaxID=1382522 RepID=W6MWU5_9ASCO|nr:uncharacterized protein KUCA_T00003855001 [Kuraishia capsulata CBS 1993]CDK27875.1 unnamed protein product [Kuraishia capsulata CBS 1993]